uniref:Carboxylic ester hydrolase n=1 Tax=Cnaphalocrocis medinalis TaxID=437488 RepID=A0A1U9X1V3_CNAME|nr:carboxylesterase [Cnaphalocrocis medinalis]
MKRLGYVILLFGLFYGVEGRARVDPLVDTKVGRIKGLVATDGDYSMFLGIPYATVDPLNPFGASIPHPVFENTFNAFDDSGACPQREEFNNTIIGSLDCLHLNIYVPRTASSSNQVPVLVYIHGGGFTFGSAGRFSHGPKFLVRHDVIIVVLNYRLGPYGFLCLDTPEIPGNQGFKDQLTALRWIKENIEAFGGDSNRITISGESAGGVAVDFHFMYTAEKLFNNIIIQSGTGLGPFSVKDSDPDAPLRLAAHLGFATNNLDDALTYLRTVDTELIIAATEATGILTSPCVEKEFENVERFITAHPIQANIPNAKSVSILIGFNNNELGGSYEYFTPEGFTNLKPFSSLGDFFNFDSEYSADMETLVRQFYIGDEDVNIAVKQQIADFSSDFTFYHPTHRSIQKYFENEARSIYYYVFSYEGDRNSVTRRSNLTNVSGALHADEITYLFDLALFDETPTPEDQLMIDRMTTMWTNFVKSSNPTPELTDTLPVQWPTVANDNVYYLNIDSELSVRQNPFHDRMAFWDLFFVLNESYLKVNNNN